MTAARLATATRFSRRSLLQATAGAGVALAAAAGSAGAQMKVSKQSVAYADQPNGGQRCSACAQFVAPTACRIVDGPISPQGYCRLFTPASRQG